MLRFAERGVHKLGPTSESGRFAAKIELVASPFVVFECDEVSSVAGSLAPCCSERDGDDGLRGAQIRSARWIEWVTAVSAGS